MTVPDERTRLDLCYDSLAGLSVGDALGAQYFTAGPHHTDLVVGRTPAGPWEWTDDSEMAFSIVAELRDHASVDRERLAATFADRCEPYRGYGGGTVVTLHAVRDGVPWREAAGAAFHGQGSCGNGAAMRVAPLGAYFTGDLPGAAKQAIRSAEVTHAHAEGILGAVAVAVAAAIAGAARLDAARLGSARLDVARLDAARPSPGDLIDALEPYLVASRVRDGLRRARSLIGATVTEAAYELGNGSRVLAEDTVPFAVWVAAMFLDDYPAAITACVQAGGDVDTTAAIVGGIVATYTGIGDDAGGDDAKAAGVEGADAKAAGAEGADANAADANGADVEAGGTRHARPPMRGLPREWLARREPLPAWAARPER